MALNPNFWPYIFTRASVVSSFPLSFVVLLLSEILSYSDPFTVIQPHYKSLWYRTKPKILFCCRFLFPSIHI